MTSISLRAIATRSLSAFAAVSMLAFPASAQSLPGPTQNGTGIFGEGLQPNERTGDASYRYDFALPEARGGKVTPSLSLVYSSSTSAGDAGDGFRLALPTIEGEMDPNRDSVREVLPYGRYSYGGQALVKICEAPRTNIADAPSVTLTPGNSVYRLRFDTTHERFVHFGVKDPNSSNVYDGSWRVYHKNGVVDFYDVLDSDKTPLHRSPYYYDNTYHGGKTSRWHLSERSEWTASHTLGNRARYVWQVLGIRGIRYLTDVFDTPINGNTPATDFAHHVKVIWEPHDFAQTAYAPIWLAKPDQRIAHIDVSSVSWSRNTRKQVRRYWFTYLRHPTISTNAKVGEAPLPNHSFLQSIQLEGTCANTDELVDGFILAPITPCPRMPATTFTWTSFRTDFKERATAINPLNASSGTPIKNPLRTSFLDLNRDGLPDVVETDADTLSPYFRTHLNRPAVPGSSIGLEEHCLDATALTETGGSNVLRLDGRTIVGSLGYENSMMWQEATGLRFAIGELWGGIRVPSGCSARGGLGRFEFQLNGAYVRDFFQLTEPFSLQNVHFAADLDRNGRTDIVYEKPHIVLPRVNVLGYVAFVPNFKNGNLVRGAPGQVLIKLDTSVELTASMPRNVVGDFNGDGLPDILMSTGFLPTQYTEYKLDFGCTNGQLGLSACTSAPTGMQNVRLAPVTGDFPGVVDGQYFGDFNGDGFTDVVSASGGASNRLLFAINEDGRNFRKVCPGDLTGASCTAASSTVALPVPAGPAARIAVVDIDGNGIDDLVSIESGRLRVISMVSGVKPGLLESVNTGLGAITSYQYDLVANLDQAASQTNPWSYHLPERRYVVTTQTEATTVLGPYRRSHVTNYSYRDPAYETWTRQFLGFREVSREEEGRTTTAKYAFDPCYGEQYDVLTPCAGTSEVYANSGIRGLLTQVDVTRTTPTLGAATPFTTTLYRSILHQTANVDGRTSFRSYSGGRDTYIFDTDIPYTNSTSTIDIGTVTTPDYTRSITIKQT
jgi:Insecticide toxin TcdB middle/N-terminal region